MLYYPQVSVPALALFHAYHEVRCVFLHQHDFFISYSKNDYDTVNAIVSKMDFYGATSWFQRRNSKQAFASAISEGIETASAFVVFLSASSVKSIYVQNEIAIAIDHLSEDDSYRILPVVIDDVDKKNPDFKALNVFLGTFNFLFLKDFSSVDELVLKIFSQVDLHIEGGGVKSIYTGNSAIEAHRITIQTELLNHYALSVIDDVFSTRKDAAVLDIGCADGNTVMSRIADKPYSLLLGVDINGEKIQAARDRFGNEKNFFLEADISADGFSAAVSDFLAKNGKTGFDVIHIAAVLLHLEKPEQALQKLYDLLLPGGCIFIQEEDDGLNQVYPPSAFFDHCFYIYDHSLESGDRHMGRKLPILLQNVGFTDISLRSATMSSLDFGGKYRDALWDMYFNTNFWDATDASYFDDIHAVDLLPSVISAHDEMREKFLRGDIFIVMGILFFVAVK